ncbi:MAG: chaperonin GroEL [Lacinutrix sp.]|uniref:chaperonin GroEL n=1 Tax=Lacinutrix sp. TaxID=1937692 RepID=UPI0030B1552C|tara:strand:+ start:1007 stop:2578 length:1572 start_codon:yes stop_codon:yes gene_type:complete
MNPKELSFDQEGRDKLLSGITTISRAVKSTLGPLGKTVLIESQNHTGGITITKDGVTVAKSIDLEDAVENLAITMMKEAADRTATSAGDGTTTAIVLTEAIVKEGMQLIQRNPEINTTQLIRDIKVVSENVIRELDLSSKKVTGKTLQHVASISANNDNVIGKMIASAYKELGKDGVLTVENSKTDKTYYEVTKGIKIDRGYSSKLFINNHRNDECILDDVYVLMTDMEITNILQIENILKPIINQNKKLLIIGNCSGNVTNTLAANVIQNNLKLCNIIPPSFGYKTNELMSDIALAIGAKYFSESQGDNIGMLSMEDLGHADKIIVGQNSTVIMNNDSSSKEAVARIEELKVQKENNSDKRERDFISERIALLSGAVGIIYVGADSDIEQKEKYDRVEDSVCAVKSAIEEGILPGGGLALLRCAELLADGNANDVMYGALISPLEQILTNAGENIKEIRDKICSCANVPYNFGYDVQNKVFGDMYKMGVIDPAKVTKNALKNAVSVATTILSTNAIVTMKRK